MINRKLLLVSLAAILFVLSILPFVRTASHDLINLDDYQYTVARAQLTDAPIRRALAWLLTSQDDAIWMPVTRLTYLLDLRLWGENPRALHTTNLLFHGLNAVFLYILLAAMYGNGFQLCLDNPEKPADDVSYQSVAPRLSDHAPDKNRMLLPAAALAALFWAVHPLRVESVAWVASRKDMVSLSFELLALIFWVRRLAYNEEEGRCRAFGWTALMAFALAGMSKPSAMTFPVLAALLEWLQGRGETRLRWRDYAAPAIMAVVMALVAQHTQTSGGATVALAAVPLHGRLLNAISAFGIYCWKTLWPTGLALQCTHRWPELPRFLAHGMVICLGYGLLLCWCGWKAGVWRRAFANHKDRPSVHVHRIATLSFVGLAWFLMAVAPMLGISNFGIHSHADRFTYLPAVGFSIILAGVLGQFVAGRTVRQFVLTGLFAVICCYGKWADWQARFWRDEGSLFERTLAVDGEKNALMRGLLGLHAYEYYGDLAKARSHFDYAFAHVRAKEIESIRGIYIEVLAESGDIERANQETRRYLEAREEESKKERDAWFRKHGTVMSDTMGYLMYAIVNLAAGDLEIAKSHIETFDRLFPRASHTSYLKGKIALIEGDTAGAIRHWKRSLADRRAYIRHRFVEKHIQELERRPVTQPSNDR